MQKTLLLLTLPFVVHVGFAQAPAGGESSTSAEPPATKNVEAPKAEAPKTLSTKTTGKTREEVKKELRLSGAVGTKNIEAPEPPMTKRERKARAKAKVEVPAAGSQSTTTTETAPPAK